MIDYKQAYSKITGILCYKSRRDAQARTESPEDKAKKMPTDHRLEELLSEREQLRHAALEPSKEIDLIFGKYEGVAVNFKVFAGQDYKTDASGLIERIFDEYAKLESPGDKMGGLKLHLMADFTTKNNFVCNTPNWRLSMGRLLDPNGWSLDVLGFIVKVHHNSNNYPRRDFLPDFEIRSQLRYRTAINEIEIALLKSDFKYELSIGDL